MEENAIDLFDYYRVIWKRKILIIVITLVCIGIGVGVRAMNSKSELILPVTYRSDVVVKIGKKIALETPSSGIPPTLTLVELPGVLEETIPLKYGMRGEKDSVYHFEVKAIDELSILKLSLEGPDREVEGVLKEIVDTLIDDHHRDAEISFALYESFIGKLEVDAKMLQKDIAVNEAVIVKLKKREVEMSKVRKNTQKGFGASSYYSRGQFNNLDMLYLEIIGREKELSQYLSRLRKVQLHLLLHKSAMDRYKKYSTEMVGKIMVTAVEPKKKKKGSSIIVHGIAGLIMSLFIAFFMEYIQESKSKRKGK